MRLFFAIFFYSTYTYAQLFSNSSGYLAPRVLDSATFFLLLSTDRLIVHSYNDSLRKLFTPSTEELSVFKHCFLSNQTFFGGTVISSCPFVAELEIIVPRKRPESKHLFLSKYCEMVKIERLEGDNDERPHLLQLTPVGAINIFDFVYLNRRPSIEFLAESEIFILDMLLKQNMHYLIESLTLQHFFFETRIEFGDNTKLTKIVFSNNALKVFDRLRKRHLVDHILPFEQRNMIDKH